VAVRGINLSKASLIPHWPKVIKSVDTLDETRDLGIFGPPTKINRKCSLFIELKDDEGNSQRRQGALERLGGVPSSILTLTRENRAQPVENRLTRPFSWNGWRSDRDVTTRELGRTKSSAVLYDQEI
jgi:hypothetical protein